VPYYIGKSEEQQGLYFWFVLTDDDDDDMNIACIYGRCLSVHHYSVSLG